MWGEACVAHVTALTSYSSVSPLSASGWYASCITSKITSATFALKTNWAEDEQSRFQMTRRLTGTPTAKYPRRTIEGGTQGEAVERHKLARLRAAIDAGIRSPDDPNFSFAKLRAKIAAEGHKRPKS